MNKNPIERCEALIEKLRRRLEDGKWKAKHDLYKKKMEAAKKELAIVIDLKAKVAK